MINYKLIHMDLTMKLTDELLIAAEKVLISKGFEAATVEEICLLAKSSRPTFYKRYKDKNALFTAYVQTKSKMLSDSLEQMAGDITDRQSFIDVSKQYLAYMYREDVLTFHSLVVGEARHNSEIRQFFRDHLVAKHGQVRQRVVTQLIISGQIEPTRNIPKLAKLLGSLITSDSYYLTVAGGQDPMTEAVLDEFVQERCDLFLSVANGVMKNEVAA